jgi:hypothetical protein
MPASDSYVYLEFEGGHWSTTPEVAASGESLSMPKGGNITVLPATRNPWMTLLVDESSSHEVRVIEREAASRWTSRGTPYTSTTGAVKSAMIAAIGGEELLVVVINAEDEIHWSKGNAMGWGTSQKFPGSDVDRMALIALPDGNAALAYRSTSGSLFTSFYRRGATPAWTMPVALSFNGVAVNIVNSPAISRGTGGRTGDGAVVELAYVRRGSDSIDRIEHTRCIAVGDTGCTNWTRPVVVGDVTGFNNVAIASMP